MNRFFVKTNKRTEHFATIPAAQLFIELHHLCQNRNNGKGEYLVGTNAHSMPRTAEGEELLHRAIKRLRQLHMNCRTWQLPAGDSAAIDLMFELVD